MRNALRWAAIFVFLFVMTTTMASCGYTSKEVGQNSVGIEYENGEITGLKAPGRHTNNKYRAELKLYDGNTKSVKWADASIWTSDKQKITIEMSVDYARNIQEVNVRKMLRLYSTAAESDEALQSLVSSKIPETVKNVTTTYKIDEMVGLGEDKSKNRETFKADIMEPLRLALELCGVDLIDLQITNIQPSAEYEAEMQKKSLIVLKKETQDQEQSLMMSQIKLQQEQDAAEADAEIAKFKKQIEVLQAQKELEAKQTELDVEKARRAALVEAAAAKVFADSPEAYELEKLKLLATMFGSKDKWFFVEPGLDISYFINGEEGTVVTPKG